MRGGGRRGGRGRGKVKEGGYGRRDARPVGAASRDDRDRRDRRPDYSPRRRPDYSPRRRPDYSPRGRSLSLGSRRARRPRREDDDREVGRGNRGPTRGGRVGNGGDRDRPHDGRRSYEGDRNPAPGRGDYSYDERSRGRRDYGDGCDLPRHGRGENHDGTRDLPHHGRRDDYGGVRDERREKDYERVPYNQERDRYYREDPSRGGSGVYNVPPAYMHPDHPSDLNRPSLLSGKNESDYLGGPGDLSLNRDGDYLGNPGRRSIIKERELFGEDGMTLKISATQSGRTTALYPEHRSPPLPPRAALPRPPPRYPSVPPEDTEFLSRGSPMKAVDGFGTGNTPLLHDNSIYKCGGDHLRDPYAERNRRTETHYSGNRGVLIEEDRGTNSLYPAVDVPIYGDRETDKLYPRRGMLGSDLVPFTQLKQIGDSSASLLDKDRPYRMHNEPEFGPSNGSAMNGHGMSPHESLGHGRVRTRRFSGRLSEHGSDHSDEALMDITRQEHSKVAPGTEYDDGYEYVPRDAIIDKYGGSVSQNPRHILSSASLAGLKDERINHHMRPSHRMEDEDRVMLYDTEDDLQHSYVARAPVPYPHARGGSGRYSHSPGFEPIGTARRPARQHEIALFEDGGDLSDREVSPMISRKRYRSPASDDHAINMHHADDGFVGRVYYDMVESDPSPQRIYDMVGEDEDDPSPRYDMPSNRNVFSRLALPHEISGEWADAEEGHPHSSTLGYGHSRDKPMSQRLSRPIAHSKFGASYVQGRGTGILTKSAKKRMKLARHHFDGGHTSPRNEFRPNELPKSSEEDNPNESEMDHEDTPEGEDRPPQKDPPEGSEEFIKQVHQAFLKYTKIVNENPTMQKKFRDGVKGSLLCCVCGSSVAKKFQDVDALVSHAYHTCKVGLKTKHLGFHKALCILMGWNWQVAPDTSKSHYSIPAEEVNAMKGDLMLWPPVVVIHNSSIGIKTKDIESKIVSKDEIEGLLADIGIPLEKAKVSHGKPDNQSVFLVQFQPTISGFQEAMKIHDHFCARNHSKEEFRQMRSGKGKQAAPVDNLDELLYAHIAVAEDLGYLDEGTKRRCVIRSKTDIEAKAEATLNLEP